MKKYLIIILSLSLLACKPETNKPAYYFNQEQQDSLVVNMIAYVAPNANNATDSTRFNAKFRADYAKQLPNYSLVYLSKDPSGIYYYFLVRPVGNLKQYRRGVVGSFTLDSASLMPKNFKEIINTPHLSEELVLERGAFLFRELVKKGNINEYMVMRDYVEWPDSTLTYNIHTNRWVYNPGK
jgi:hypothetical protein